MEHRPMREPPVDLLGDIGAYGEQVFFR